MSKKKELGATASMIKAAVNLQIKTIGELASECGWESSNVLSMILNGRMRVPMERVPALAQVLGLDRAELLAVLLKEYRKGEWDVLVECFGLPESNIGSDRQDCKVDLFGKSG